VNGAHRSSDANEATTAHLAAPRRNDADDVLVNRDRLDSVEATGIGGRVIPCATTCFRDKTQS